MQLLTFLIQKENSLKTLQPTKQIQDEQDLQLE